MSANAYWITAPLDCRSAAIRSGIRGEVKRTLRRRDRHTANAELHGLNPDNDIEVPSAYEFDDRNFHDPDLFASAHSLEDELEQREFEQEEDLYLLTRSEDQIPLHLQGSLPDWALDQMSDAQGHAMHLHAMFECRPNVRRPVSFYDAPMNEIGE